RCPPASKSSTTSPARRPGRSASRNCVAHLWLRLLLLVFRILFFRSLNRRTTSPQAPRARDRVTEHLNFLLLGLGNGAVFAALAMALVVTYRSSGVLNFATGALALHGAYTYAFLRHGQLLNPVPPLASTVDLGGPVGFAPALVITLVVEALVGVVLYLAVFRWLRNAVPVARAVASLGVMVVLTALIAEQAGSNQTLVA